MLFAFKESLKDCFYKYIIYYINILLVS